MKKMKKSFLAATSLIVALILAIPSVAVSQVSDDGKNISAIVTESDGGITEVDDYSYVDYASEIDIDAEYAHNSIIVSMKKGESEINKVYTSYKETLYIYRGTSGSTFRSPSVCPIDANYYTYY